MKPTLSKIIFGLILSVVVVVIVVFVVQNKKTDQVPQNEIGIEIDTGTDADTDTGTDISTEERTLSRFVCVGEYCDGSMDGDDHLEKYTVVNIPLVKEAQPNSTAIIGCGSEIFFAPHTVPKTTAVMDATYTLLFDLKPVPEIPADGFRNVVGAYTQLLYDRITLNNGTAKLYLTGTMYGPGHCAEPELKAQIEQSALQYPTVDRLEVYMNNTIFDWCSMDQSDGEGPCPENPQYWIVEKK